MLKATDLRGLSAIIPTPARAGAQVLTATDTIDLDETERLINALPKVRIEAAGYRKPGPIRPPYDVFPEEYAAAARECGRRWAELRRRLKAA